MYKLKSPTHRNRRGQIKLLFDLPPSIACTVRLPHNDPDCIQGSRGAGILSGLFWLPVRQFYGTVCYSHGYNFAECPLSGNARDMPSCCHVRALSVLFQCVNKCNGRNSCGRYYICLHFVGYIVPAGTSRTQRTAKFPTLSIVTFSPLSLSAPGQYTNDENANPKRTSILLNWVQQAFSLF